MEGKFGRERDESEHQETKVMVCGRRDKEGVYEKSGKFPCGICGKEVGSNSIVCTACNKWIHGRRSGIKGRVGVGDEFICKRCCEARNNLQTVQVVNGKGSDIREMDMGGSLKLEVVNSFVI